MKKNIYMSIIVCIVYIAFHSRVARMETVFIENVCIVTTFSSRLFASPSVFIDYNFSHLSFSHHFIIICLCTYVHVCVCVCVCVPGFRTLS